MARVKLGLRNLTVTETIMKGNLILHRMQGNPHLPPDPIPSLQEIAASLSELKAAVSACYFGGKLNIMMKNDRKKKFLALLRRLGGWISSQTSDEMVINSTGFKAISGKGHKHAMEKPKYINKKFNAATCILKIYWQPVHGSKQYIVESSQSPYDDNAQWSIAGYTSKASYIPDRNKMKPLTPYYYRVRALGTSGIGPPSDIVKGAIF